jgi:pimeloyl-ACP methyl ester carboxylesterase
MNEMTKQATLATNLVVHHRFETIEGVKIFYREAGLSDGPVVLLLHGYPASSHMFRNLIPTLADRYRVIAPDYPAFGQSDMPDRSSFAYTFEHYADIVDELVGRLGAKRYAMYVQNYGAPIGYRVALKHPERVTSLIVQNGNAYDEGMKNWDPIRRYWVDGSQEHRQALSGLISVERAIMVTARNVIPVFIATLVTLYHAYACRVAVW